MESGIDRFDFFALGEIQRWTKVFAHSITISMKHYRYFKHRNTKLHDNPVDLVSGRENLHFTNLGSFSSKDVFTSCSKLLLSRKFKRTLKSLRNFFRDYLEGNFHNFQDRDLPLKLANVFSSFAILSNREYQYWRGKNSRNSSRNSNNSNNSRNSSIDFVIKS